MAAYEDAMHGRVVLMWLGDRGGFVPKHPRIVAATCQYTVVIDADRCCYGTGFKQIKRHHLPVLRRGRISQKSIESEPIASHICVDPLGIAGGYLAVKYMQLFNSHMSCSSLCHQ